MTPAISTSIVGVQVALLLLAVIIGLAARSKRTASTFAWINTVLAFAAMGLAAAAIAGVKAIDGSTSSFIVYGATALIAAAFTWGATAVVSARLRLEQERHYASPETREAMAAELREVLRAEGIALDERLGRAEQEREQFLYALEDRHAKQISGLAQEYQHEAHTILRSLLEQLAADQLEPMVQERLDAQREALEAELGAIDSAASGEALTKLRAEYREMLEAVERAEGRVDDLKSAHPDLTAGELVEVQLEEARRALEAKVESMQDAFDAAIDERVARLEGRFSEVDGLLSEKVEAAGNPLVVRMAETQAAVETQLNTWMGVLDARFAETEQILGQRTVEQEHALENRVVEMEQAIEERLAQHVVAVEQVLADHDAQLQAALGDQSNAIGQHFSIERDRLITELTEHTVSLQEQVAGELTLAEQRARETVEATQVAWNHFTEELEQRFAETRHEALKAAHEIAEEERIALTTQLNEITQGTSSDIAQKVEQLGREAAWQRAQVERTVAEAMDSLQQHASGAVSNADAIFADLTRMGDERVDLIRRQAEDALVQSRDYVGQLQESLGLHLDTLRDRSGNLAEEMNDRLASITQASQESAAQLEQYAHQLVEATSRELGSVAERATSDLQGRINGEFTSTVESALEAQKRTYEVHLSEVAQRIMQQVQGDLAGLAEHARGAVTGELDQIIASAREHAQRSQEQAFMQVMGDLARQQAELAEQARSATGDARRLLEDGLRDNRRQLEEAMASMGAHMREELVRFGDEGQRRVAAVIDQLRGKEQELVREEDRRLASARQELVRQHQGALENQVRSMVGGLSQTLGTGEPAGTAGGFTSGIERPTTPLSGFQG